MAISVLAALVCSILLVWSSRVEKGLLHRIEGATLDLRFLVRGPEEPDPEIAVVAIDQQSLDKYGRWPWSRLQLAKLIEGIDAGAELSPKAIALDIAFPQAEPLDSKLVIDLLMAYSEEQEDAELSPALERAMVRSDPNRILSEMIRRAGCVVPAAFFLTTGPARPESDFDSLAEDFAVPVVMGIDNPDPKRFIVWARSAEPNIAEIKQASAGTGFFNVFPDSDGMMRHKHLLLGFGEDIYPSLEVATLRVAMGVAHDELMCRFAQYGAKGIGIGKKWIETDERGRILLNYRGPVGTFETFSAKDILDGRIDGSVFTDRIVLVGLTALGNFDVAVTPFDPQGYPGVEVHATALDNIKNDRSLVRPAWYVLFDLVLIWLLAVAGGQAFVNLRPWLAGFCGIVLLVGLWALVYELFTGFNYVLGLSIPVLSLVLTFIAVILYRLLVEVRLQFKLKRAFTPYVPMPVAQRIAEDPDSAHLEGARRQITVLFVDIRGFSTLTSKVSPEALVGFLGEFAHEVSDAVFETRGLLDKFIGDGAMAFWGAPLDAPDQVESALECAVDIHRRMKAVARRHDADEFGGTTVGVGIATGEAVVGAMGSMRRLDYTAVGEVVNLAQRLEKLNRELRTRVLASASTAEKATEKWRFISKGKRDLIRDLEPVEVFELEMD